MVGPDGTIELALARLAEGSPGITEAEGRRLAEAGAVCLSTSGHVDGALLNVNGSFTVACRLHWPEVHGQMLRSLSDMQEATERGACGIAIHLITELTEYHTIERARKGTGIDYWLGRKDDTRWGLAARLEVSGILSGDEKAIQKRVKQKKGQTKRSDGPLPAYVVVEEFSTPTATVVKR